jgi:hypothetical protein
MISDVVLVHVSIIAAYGFLSHAVILLHDGLHWDGWLVDFWQRTRNWQVMKRFYDEVGLTPLYYQHKLLSRLPARIFAYRLIAFLSTLLSAIAVYCLCNRIGFLDEFYALLIALLYLSYTGYHMNVDTVVGVQYTFPTTLFYWAIYLALLAGDYSGMAHAGLRGAALLLFFLAFNANSLLVYYFGFLGLKLLLGWDSANELWINLYRELAGNIDYAAIPFAYWLLKNRLMPRHGHYESYNRIRFDWLMLPKTLFDSIRFGFEAPITSPFRLAIANHRLWIPATGGALAYWLLADAPAYVQAIAPMQIAVMLGTGATLLILAALPYALVGQSFFPEGWGTKHHMLFHFPVSLIILGMTGWLLSPTVMFGTIMFMLACNAMHLNLVYLHHIAVAVKNRSWLYKLSRIERAKGASIFLITDRHSIKGDPCNPEQEHRPAYLFCMFEWLWGDKTHCGFLFAEPVRARLASDQIAKEIARSTLDYDMREVNAAGAQARLLISDGTGHSSIKVALLYLKERYLPGGDVARLLENVTDLEYAEL